MSAGDHALDHDELQQLMDKLVRDVPDFPQPGVTFKDITPLLADHDGLRGGRGRARGGRAATTDGAVVVDKVVGIEARGFILAAPVALALGRRLRAGAQGRQAAARDPRGLLRPGVRRGHLEVHQDAIDQGERVLIVDDVLATGGTADATRQLVERSGGDPARARVLHRAVVPARS